MREKILWRTPQIRSSIFFFLLSPWWLYLIYCFSFFQSIFSLQAFKIVMINYWFLFFTSLFVSVGMYLLWIPIVVFALIHAVLTFYLSSVFLLSTTNKFYLIFNILFLVGAGFNLLHWLRDANLACYQKQHYIRGFFGQILKKISGELHVPGKRDLAIELIDWDEESVKMKVIDEVTDLDFLAENDLALHINYQSKDFWLKVHATVWAKDAKMLGVRVLKDSGPQNIYGPSFDAFYSLTKLSGHEPSKLY